MRYALSLPDGGECGDPRFLLELAERAEAAGWDALFLEDGSPRSDDVEADRAHVRSVEEAGATWWVEWIAPAERNSMRGSVDRGPVRQT